MHLLVRSELLTAGHVNSGWYVCVTSLIQTQHFYSFSKGKESNIEHLYCNFSPFQVFNYLI